MYAQLGTEVREIFRTGGRTASTTPLWWCPFCDCSNQLRLDTPTGAARPCGKCGATVLLTKPAPASGKEQCPSCWHAPDGWHYAGCSLVLGKKNTR